MPLIHRPPSVCGFKKTLWWKSTVNKSVWCYFMYYETHHVLLMELLTWGSSLHIFFSPPFPSSMFCFQLSGLSYGTLTTVSQYEVSRTSRKHSCDFWTQADNNPTGWKRPSGENLSHCQCCYSIFLCTPWKQRTQRLIIYGSHILRNTSLLLN